MRKLKVTYTAEFDDQQCGAILLQNPNAEKAVFLKLLLMSGLEKSQGQATWETIEYTEAPSVAAATDADDSEAKATEETVPPVL